MSTIFLASVLSLIIGANSINDCQYFGTATGPLIPIDVCMKWDTAELTGAYSYECDGLGAVYMNAWDNDDCSGPSTATSEGAIIPEILNCGGGVCNHVIIREYQFTEIRQDMCYKNESYNPYFEYAFVTDCWDSVVVPDRSWSVDCTSNSMSLKFWDDNSCNGNAKNITKITEGCEIRSDIIIPKFNVTFNNFTIPTFNYTRNSNDTYFEIKGCGDATQPWLWILITCIVALCCTGCCCFCLCRYFCKKGCKCKCKNSGKNIDPLIINTTKEGDYTTTA